MLMPVTVHRLKELVCGDTVITVHDRKSEKGIIFRRPAFCLVEDKWHDYEILWMHAEGERHLYVEVDHIESIEVDADELLQEED